MKLSIFKPSLVTEVFHESELKNHPERINKGYCMRWAYYAYSMFEGIELWSIPTHAYVKHGNLFFDSERLNGVIDWRDLPACNNGRLLGPGYECGILGCAPGCGKAPLHHAVDDFKRYWITNRIVPTWDEYDSHIIKFMKRVT